MNEAMFLDDVLIGIGYNMPEARKGFRDSDRDFPVFFYQRRERFPHVLGRLMFNTNGQYPISPELNEAKRDLAINGLLVFSMTMPCYYQFHPAVNTGYSTFVSKIITDRQAQDWFK